MHFNLAYCNILCCRTIQKGQQEILKDITTDKKLLDNSFNERPVDSECSPIPRDAKEVHDQIADEADVQNQQDQEASLSAEGLVEGMDIATGDTGMVTEDSPNIPVESNMGMQCENRELSENSKETAMETEETYIVAKETAIENRENVVSTNAMISQTTAVKTVDIGSRDDASDKMADAVDMLVKDGVTRDEQIGLIDEKIGPVVSAIGGVYE